MAFIRVSDDKRIENVFRLRRRVSVRYLGYRLYKVLRSGPIRPTQIFVTSTQICRRIIVQMG